MTPESEPVPRARLPNCPPRKRAAALGSIHKALRRVRRACALNHSAVSRPYAGHGRLARTVGKCSGACSGRFELSPSVNPATCGAMSARFSYKTTTVESTRDLIHPVEGPAKMCVTHCVDRRLGIQMKKKNSTLAELSLNERNPRRMSDHQRDS